MTTHEQVNVQIKSFTDQLATWEARRAELLKPVAVELAQCEKMIRHAKKSLRIYQTLADTLNGNQTGTASVAGGAIEVRL